MTFAQTRTLENLRLAAVNAGLAVTIEHYARDSAEGARVRVAGTRGWETIGIAPDGSTVPASMGPTYDAPLARFVRRFLQTSKEGA